MSRFSQFTTSADLKPQDLLDSRFRGLAMPMDKKPGGFFHTSFTRSLIKSRIVMILMTRLGERVMLPEFGSRLWKLVFDQNDAISRRLAQRYIIDDLGRWEPRVRVTAVRADTDEHRLQILVDYEIVSISVQDAVTLVFRREEQAGGAPRGSGGI